MDAVLILDPQGFILYANKGAGKLFGKHEEQLIGENFGYPVTPFEIQEIWVAQNKKNLNLEMLANKIMWEEKPAFLVSLRDVTEKKNLESELRTANNQLKKQTLGLKSLNEALLESNTSLEQFAHVASHDLKEPLRKIKTFCYRIEDDCKANLPPNCINYLHKIVASVTRMNDMIEGVLTYSSIRASDQPIERIDLTETIKHVETDLEELIKQKQAVIQYDNLPQLDGANALIYQLFYNLILNALKFSKKEERPIIYLTSKVITKRKKQYAVIVLKDNGIGFDQAQAEKIFESFTRLNSKDKFEGTGLGLSLCKKIVTRHNGSIEAKGIENKGAEFHITLPLKQNRGIG